MSRPPGSARSPRPARPEPVERTRKDGTTWTSHGPASGIPARGTGTRPPFAPGNAAALKSGARSPRVVSGVAAGLAADLLDRRPDLAAYPEAVERWATSAAVALLLTRRLDEVGVIDPETGNPRTGLLRHLTSASNAAERAGMLLGLDPSSEARLARDRAATAHLSVDIAAILARGQAATDEPAALPDREPLVSAVLAGLAAENRTLMAASAAEHAARGLAPAPTDEPAESTEHDDRDDESEPTS